MPQFLYKIFNILRAQTRPRTLHHSASRDLQQPLEDSNLGGIVGHKLLLHACFQSIHPSGIAQNLQTDKRN